MSGFRTTHPSRYRLRQPAGSLKLKLAGMDGEARKVLESAGAVEGVASPLTTIFDVSSYLQEVDAGLQGFVSQNRKNQRHQLGNHKLVRHFV